MTAFKKFDDYETWAEECRAGYLKWARAPLEECNLTMHWGLPNGSHGIHTVRSALEAKHQCQSTEEEAIYLWRFHVWKYYSTGVNDFYQIIADFANVDKEPAFELKEDEEEDATPDTPTSISVG